MIKKSCFFFFGGCIGLIKVFFFLISRWNVLPKTLLRAHDVVFYSDMFVSLWIKGRKSLTCQYYFIREYAYVKKGK